MYRRKKKQMQLAHNAHAKAFTPTAKEAAADSAHGSKKARERAARGEFFEAVMGDVTKIERFKKAVHLTKLVQDSNFGTVLWLKVRDAQTGEETIAVEGDCGWKSGSNFGQVKRAIKSMGYDVADLKDCRDISPPGDEVKKGHA